MNGVIGIISSERNNFSWYFIQSLLALKERMPQIKIAHSHAGTIPDARNSILDVAKQLNADYVCMIDSDMTFPSFGIDQLLETMEKMDAKIGCGMYFGTYPPYVSKPMAYDEKDGKQIALDEWNEPRYITSCGMGFTIIKKELFDIKFIFKPNEGEDHLFCKEVRERGEKIILDTNVKCGHIRTLPLYEDGVKALQAVNLF